MEKFAYSLLKLFLCICLLITNTSHICAVDSGNENQPFNSEEDTTTVIDENSSQVIEEDNNVLPSETPIETFIPEQPMDSPLPIEPVESYIPEATIVPSEYPEETPMITPEDTQQPQTNPLIVDQQNTIIIYNLKQLQAIGTNQVVNSLDYDENSFGLGEQVVDSEGNNITYSSNATYKIANEISLNGTSWNLHKDFDGNFVNNNESLKTSIYDETTNTVYVSNTFQLDLIVNFYQGKEASPILSNDLDVNMFGAGQLIYPTGSDQFLYYDDTHNYVITTCFTQQRPLNDNLQTQIEATAKPEVTPEIEVYAPEASTNEHLYGRDYVGQVYKEIGESKTRYILIGNKQQLSAIGSNKQVTPMLFLRTQRILGGDTIVPYYPGDADFEINSFDETKIASKDIDDNAMNFQYKRQTSKANDLMDIKWGSDTLLGEIVGVVGTLLGGILSTLKYNEIVGLKINTDGVSIGAYKDLIFNKNTEFTSFADLKHDYEKLKYSSDANYIIFRDIDLANVDWKPLMFSGYMTGAKAENGNDPGSLWKDGNIKENQVTISNVNVNQSTAIDMETQSGVGFFGSIMSNATQNVFNDNVSILSKGQVVVKNITLNNVKVANNTNDIAMKPEGIIDSITGLLGGLLDVLLGQLGTILNRLLNPKSNNPTVFATGAFAGRIVGEVVIENCYVDGIVEVTNVNNMTGGFAGHIEGITEYKVVGPVINALVNVLEHLLNIIPGIDIGTLIHVLLDGEIVKLENLFPTGYKQPEINNCHLSRNVDSGPFIIGNENAISVGGFAGNIIGARVKDCSVKIPSLEVKGNSLVGGFGGLVSNGELVGILEDLGVNLINNVILNSFVLNCNVTADTMRINANKMYAGGFAGALANSIIVDSTIQGKVEILSESYAGGFTGLASLGQSISLGKDFYTGKKNLVELIGQIANDLITDDKRNGLLSLTGVSPSVLAGISIDGGLVVSASKDYAGGLVGQGAGVQIFPSNQLEEKSYAWRKANISYDLKGLNTNINKLSKVSGHSYVGGLIGEATTASAAGILNRVLGAANFLGFDIEDVELNFTQDALVQATNECAGGLAGRAIGGTITNANVNNLSTVTANNMAGGFIGHGGTGSLAETGGLNILGLIEISNLISLADGVVLKINNSNVTGSEAARLSVSAKGSNTQETTDITKYYAGGFIGKSTSVHINNCHVTNLKNVEANMQSGYAGGFAGITETGGLAEAASENTSALSLIDINGLLGAIPYLVSEFRNVTVKYLSVGSDIQVKASNAGGFIGQMQSGLVDNSSSDQLVIEPYAVYNLKNVEGEYYAGGFAGRIVAGGLANANDLSILGGLKLIEGINVNINQLLSVLDVYIPDVINAGVLSSENENDNSTEGLIVKSNSIDNSDLNSGSAGGYVGYASGAHIKNSSVRQLRNTKVTAPSDLNDPIADGFYGNESSYAINAKRYAGGYAGKLDIGNTASLSDGLNALNLLKINELVNALAVTATKVEHSDVYGALGGYSVLANGINDNKIIGNAGGFAGGIYGSQLQNCNSYNFEYVIGKETAGGYVGALEPGDVAKAVGNTNILGGLLSVSNNLATVLESFIPMIYNSQTTCIPCGGAVRADAMSSDGIARGLAGGYVGYNIGGRIEGNSTRNWNGDEPAAEVLKENAVFRLRSVYGYEYAGGFSGRSESGSVADIGSIKVLFGLVSIANPVSALNAVYFTDKNTAVYGPLKGLTMDQWNSWVNNVGVNGSYGLKLETVDTDDKLNSMIEQYAYGYEVKAGRDIAGKTNIEGGVAGGYVGRMDGGQITSAHANDLKLVTASRSSGGFAGEMIAAGAANVGSINLAGLDIINNLPVLQTFVPVINSSSTTGYKSGATILATGTDTDNFQGNAGGYVGYAVGAQIEGNEQEFCSINKLRTVKGTNTVGGFAGSIVTGSAVDVKVGTKDSLLPQILGGLIQDAGNLASVLNAVLSHVKYAKVEAWDDWGVTIDGSYKVASEQDTKYAYAAGGFVGNFSGSILGDRETTGDSVIARNIKSVIGGDHVGGFFGLADVAALTQVGEDKTQTSILDLIQLGSLDVLDAFRPYIYHGSITGSPINGLSVSAYHDRSSGVIEEVRYTGNAGGFGGSLLNGSVKNSNVTNLNQVNGLNYTGGFVGHLGKSGVVSLSDASVSGSNFKLLNATAGVLDNFGSHVDDSYVSGFNSGYTVKSTNGNDEIAGGFAGYADLAKINRSHATNLKKVSSSKTAGGFVGRATFSYLAKIDADSKNLLNPILTIVNHLLNLLYYSDLQDLGVINIGFGNFLEIKLLSDGRTLAVTLLGLSISVALVKNNGVGTTDVAQIHIGDSYIELPCNGSGIIDSDENTKNLTIGLIKSNRTGIRKSSVTGIGSGYDVFGGNATDTTSSNTTKGNAGGFAGFNHEGLIQDCDMYYADTIKGSSGSIGPFSGVTELDSVYDLVAVKNIEGVNNHYRIYRSNSYETLITGSGNIIIGELDLNGKFNSFKVSHRINVEEYKYLKSSELSNRNEKADAKVYISDAKAVLMGDTITSENDETITPPPSEMQDPCNSTIDLTINKIWNDFGNYETRPESITVVLKRYIVVAGQDEQLDQNYSKQIIISGNKENNIWQHIEKDLPMVIDNGQSYYRYVLEEASVSGYASKIEYSEDGFTITITNTRTPVLPETGGIGNHWFIGIGSFGILMILTSYLRRKKENEVEN